MARTLRARWRSQPSITIALIVEPDDRDWLDRARASISAQAWPRLELLELDVDPAPDPAHAQAHPTWQDAANAAAQQARGELIGWLRGCDTLEPGALRALAAGNADLATGTLNQRGEPDEALTRAQVAAHRRPGNGLDATSRPELAGGLAVGNCLVRRSTWQEGGLRFTAADDWLSSPTMTQFLTIARTVTITDHPVATHAPDHGYRAFGATPSPWPQLAGDLHRADQITRILADTVYADPWVRHRAGHALWPYLLDVERAEEAQWRSLVQAAQLSIATPSDDVEARTLAWLAAHDRRADVATLASAIARLDGDLPTRLIGAEICAAWPELPGDIPEQVIRLSHAQTAGRAVAIRRDPNAATVDLAVYIDRLDLHDADVEIAAQAADGALRVQRRPGAPAADRFHTGIEITIETDALRARLEVAVGGLQRSIDADLVPPRRRPASEDVHVRLSDLAADDGHLVVATAGQSTAGPGPDELFLLDEHDQHVAEAVAGRIALRDRHFGRDRPLAVGTYRLLTPHGTPSLDPALEAQLPLDLSTDQHRITVQRGPFGGVQVRLSAPLADSDRGPYNQRRLIEAYQASTAPIQPGTVYFETYAGASATDSGLAIHDALRARRPDLRTVWGVADERSWTPPGAERVLLRSAAWYATLATAQTLVLNTDVELWFARRPGQFLLQTFHGYPSKGMGRVQWEAKEYPPSRVAQMRARGVETWSAILTPTPAMTAHYREQYDYQGPAFEHGYPRDDVLTSAGAEQIRQRTRDLLGVGADQRVILYAPTWREHLATRARRAEMDDHLDLDAAANALGPGHVLLLRGHRFHGSTTPTKAGTARVLDVTDYPEINDLILACDAAILDYSSLRFDVALAGRPAVFLVPDLAEYAQGTRQFLYPFTDSAPGPLVATTAEVVEQVRDVEKLHAEWAAQIADFNARYHPYQDGHAADRVAEQIISRMTAP